MNETKLCEKCLTELFCDLFSIVLLYEKEEKHLSTIQKVYNWECEKCGNILLEITADLRNRGTNGSIKYNIIKK